MNTFIMSGMNKGSSINLEGSQFNPGTKKGHYESYFLRANHPEKAQAFWIRYTLFSPKGHTDRAIGEIWAMFFDGEKNQIVAVQEDIPFQECSISSEKLSIRLGNNKLERGLLSGSASLNGHTIEWDLSYLGEEKPLLFFPERMYQTPLPKAKSLVTAPNVKFKGTLSVDTDTWEIESWQGSENHNWGSKHTDKYAWGQVAGFDNDSNVFLECSSARIKLGPIWSPWMTLAVVRIDGREYSFNSVIQAVKANGKYDYLSLNNYFNWQFETKNNEAQLQVKISAPNDKFVGLTYKNPPGGTHTCLNSKIAGCELTITEKGKRPRTFQTKHRAAFEILTDDNCHGVEILN